MGENSLLDKNLDNIDYEIDLFGDKIEKLSMRDRIGFLPISIWEPNWNIVKNLKSIIGDEGQAREDCAINANSKIRGGGGKSYPKVASIFNPHLAQMILSAYCPQNAKIYDAFGGGGTRGFTASAMGHNYTGIEIRQEEVDRILNKQKILDRHFDIICADSRYYDIQENSFDFSYTCPPYYNLEIYSNMNGDMSNANSYDEFLEMLKQSMQITYKGLKKNSLSIWVIGNFRNIKGNLVSFNCDLIKLAKEVKFKLHDEIIFWGASKCAAQRCGNFKANRKSVRVHEYILIFKKG